MPIRFIPHMVSYLKNLSIVIFIPDAVASREDLRLANRFVHEKAEQALGKSVPCRGRHAVFQRFHELHVSHLGLLIARITQRLLAGKTFGLIDRIIQLAVSLPQLAPGDDEMEAWVKPLASRESTLLEAT